MARSWIVTANGGRAYVYSQIKPSGPLDKVTEILNANASSVTAETESDKLGQLAASKSRHGGGAPTQSSGYEPDQTPAKHHAELLARKLADFLVKGYHSNSYEQIYLFASPEFLGVLRKLLDSKLSSLIAVEVDKDYTQLSPNQLREQIDSQAAA
jgi:protein required for attachment to host cells